MPLTPIFLSTRGRVTPGLSASTMKPHMSVCNLEDGSPVLAKTVNQLACIPPDIQHLVPLRTNPPGTSGSAMARVCMPATSDPAPGSERQNAARDVPLAMPGR